MQWLNSAGHCSQTDECCNKNIFPRSLRLRRYPVLLLAGLIVAMLLQMRMLQPSSLMQTMKDDDLVLRQNTETRIWVQITLSLEYEPHILPHILDHYVHKLGADPNFILLSLHHRNENATKHFQSAEENCQQNYGIHHIQRWSGDYDSNRLWQTRQTHRENANIHPCDWIVRSDADEFPVIPGGNLEAFLSVIGDQGYDAVFGKFNDRVTIDGSLVDISPAPGINEQFPLSCDVTDELANANTMKAIAFRGYHKENRGGHELMEKNHHDYESRKKKGNDHCGYPIVLRIDHYKWTSQAIQKLLVRSKHYQKIKIGHYKQSADILEHILKNTGLDVHLLGCSRSEDYHTGSEGLIRPGSLFYDHGRTCMNSERVCPDCTYAKDGPSFLFEKHRRSWMSTLENEWDKMNHATKVNSAIVGEHSTKIPGDAITAALHADLDQWNRLMFVIMRWNGPVSASLYITKKGDISRFQKLHHQWRRQLEQVNFSIMMERSTSLGYPHNALRQMSLSNVKTKFFCTLDVDVYPIVNAFEALLKTIRHDRSLYDALTNRKLMILPAFHRELNASDAIDETNVFHLAETHLPLNLSDIHKGLEARTLSIHERPRMEKSPNWFNVSTDAPDTSHYFSNVPFQVGISPFVLGSRDDIELPHYWQALRGQTFGQNAWAMQAHWMGFEFGVLKEFFVTHLNQLDDNLRENLELSPETLSGVQKYLTSLLQQPHAAK